MSDENATTPKQFESGQPSRRFRPSSPIDVGDMVAELPDGAICSAASWTGTRAEFAAKFRGLSFSFFDPETWRGPWAPPILAGMGGVWTFTVRGEVKEGDTLGPEQDADGKLSSWALESVPADEAVAVLKGGKVKLYAKPGG